MAAILVFKPAKSPKVGAKLRRLREKAGFSTSEMALYLGYTRKQIENWVATAHEPGDDDRVRP